MDGEMMQRVWALPWGNLAKEFANLINGAGVSQRNELRSNFWSKWDTVELAYGLWGKSQ